MIIGRAGEIKLLDSFLKKEKAVFLAIYGRRRTGKTHLIREFFKGKGAYLEVTGRKGQSEAKQLRTFTNAYAHTYLDNSEIPVFKSWYEAFDLLSKQIEKQTNKRHIIFLDELPWLAGKRSQILSEIDFFWNTKWSQMPNIILIVCGSAASWIIKKIINAKGGLYNRVTDIIHLHPFSLMEFLSFLEFRKIKLSLFDLAELYLAVGGIPHYLNMLNPEYSVAQNINYLFFSENSPLKEEYDRLFAALFDSSDKHSRLINLLSQKRTGVSRVKLKEKLKVASGTLNKILTELEASDFIKKHIPFARTIRSGNYRITDEFCLFYLKWVLPVKNQRLNQDYWITQQQSSAWRAWAGYSFENLCEKHNQQILQSLQIAGIQSMTSKWHYFAEKSTLSKGLSGAEIDLVIDRADNIINLCEIKFTREKFLANKKYIDDLQKRIAIFKEVTKTRKSLVPILISARGAIDNEYLQSNFLKMISLDDLFSPHYSSKAVARGK